MATIAIAAPQMRVSKDGVKTVLRAEGLAMLVAALTFYTRLDFGWLLFAALFLLPDLSFAFYRFGPRAGAAAYNTLHSTMGPLGLGALGLLLARPSLVAIAAIWLAHVGFDRALGYGLKYGDAFGHTHLGWIGKSEVANSEVANSE
jgi:hypothetical protein